MSMSSTRVLGSTWVSPSSLRRTLFIDSVVEETFSEIAEPGILIEEKNTFLHFATPGLKADCSLPQTEPGCSKPGLGMSSSRSVARVYKPPGFQSTPYTQRISERDCWFGAAARVSLDDAFLACADFTLEEPAHLPDHETVCEQGLTPNAARLVLSIAEHLPAPIKISLADACAPTCLTLCLADALL